MYCQDRELPYGELRSFEALLGHEELQVVTRPGFADWDEISQAEALLATWTEISEGARVLIFPCGHGALGVWAAKATDVTGASPPHIILRDTNAIAVAMAQLTAAENDRDAIDVSAALPEPESADVALMPLPKGRDLARLMLLSAARALSPGGQLYLAGANRAGIKSVAGDAEALLGQGRLLAYKGGNRVLRFTRETALDDEHLPIEFRAPGIPEGTYAEIDVTIPSPRRQSQDAFYRLLTRPGVFSWEHLDPGTALLLSAVRAKADDRLLDTGCGYGLIGIHLGRQATEGEALLVDVDLLACECARRNVARYGPEHATVRHDDALACLSDGPFSLIVSNPPFHSGQAVSVDMTHALIEGAYDALERNGRLVLVANRFLPYDAAMEERFGNVATVVATPQYHVLESRKRHRRGSRRGSGTSLGPEAYR